MKLLQSSTGLIALLILFAVSATMIFVTKATVDGGQFDQAIAANTDRMMEEGRETFRYDTFGDEAFWVAYYLRRAASSPVGHTASTCPEGLNSDSLPDTAESTVNVVVGKRFSKKQPMQRPCGAGHTCSCRREPGC